MKAVLNEVGPIAVSINASLKTFQLYSEGMKIIPTIKKLFYSHNEMINWLLLIRISW